MKIFLTGASGYLGSNIVKYIDGIYFTYKRGNDILKDLNSFKPDYIIHSAAEIYKKELMFDSNVILTYNILEYVKQNPHIKMIYIGSSSEYGKVLTKMSETTPINSYSIYAATKSCGALLCQAYAREFDLDICIVRPFSVYGTNEPRHRLIPTLFNNIIENKGVSIIKGQHDFIYIEDFIRLINIFFLFQNNSNVSTH